jgi:DNA polymerase-3 subunit alpha
VPQAEADMLWRTIEGFAEYGFNRAHATMYGLTAYRTAYLKTHYPVPYFAALLASFEGTKDKETWYRNAARQHGVKVRPAKVGISGSHYTFDRARNSVRRGLRSVKGVGGIAADHIATHGPYTDLDDLIIKCGSRPVTGGKEYLLTHNPGDLCGTLGALYEAGALDGLLQLEPV